MLAIKHHVRIDDSLAYFCFKMSGTLNWSVQSVDWSLFNFFCIFFASKYLICKGWPYIDFDCFLSRYDIVRPFVLTPVAILELKRNAVLILLHLYVHILWRIEYDFTIQQARPSFGLEWEHFKLSDERENKIRSWAWTHSRPQQSFLGPSHSFDLPFIHLVVNRLDSASSGSQIQLIIIKWQWYGRKIRELKEPYMLYEFNKFGKGNQHSVVARFYLLHKCITLYGQLLYTYVYLYAPCARNLIL